MIINPFVAIPLEVIKTSFETKTVSRLKVFVTAKMYANDFFDLNSDKFEAVIRHSGFKRRTVLKHIQKLVEQNWMGYDSKNKRYYIRSWKQIRASKAFSHTESVVASTKDIKSFRELLFSSLVKKKIQKQQYYNYTLAIKENKISIGTVKKLRSYGSVKAKAALQVYQSQQPTNGLSYFGLSNKGLSKLIGLSQSRASYIKKRSSDCGYIEVNQKFDVLAEFPDKIENLRDLYLKGHGSDDKYIRIRCILRDDKKVYQVLRQLMSEIIPLEINLKYISMKR